MKNKENKKETKVKIKGDKNFWQRYLKKLEKAKKEGCVSCSCDK